MNYAINGNIYDGEWGSKRHGKGIITFPNGDVFSGEWTSQQRQQQQHQKKVSILIPTILH
jgi:hypothetical protein